MIVAGDGARILAVVDSSTLEMDGFKTSGEIRRISATPDRDADSRASRIVRLRVKPLKRTDLLRLVCDAMEASIRDDQNRDTGWPRRDRACVPVRSKGRGS